MRQRGGREEAEDEAERRQRGGRHEQRGGRELGMTGGREEADMRQREAERRQT